MSETALSLSMAELFKPFTLSGVTLPNRILMAPMTRNFSPGGVPGADVAAYYRRRAEADVGLILTEGTAPHHPQAKNMPNVPHIYGQEALAGWKRVVEGVHAAGGRIFSQLWHVGAVQSQNTPKLPVSPVSPSGLLKPGVKIGEPMTQSDIDAVIAVGSVTLDVDFMVSLGRMSAPPSTAGEMGEEYTSTGCSKCSHAEISISWRWVVRC